MNLAAAVLLMLSLATPASELDRLRLSGDADPQRVAEVLEAGLAKRVGQTRPQQCMDAFLAGELYRRADAAAPGLGYAEQALKRFRAMRVDYMDLEAGQLGYIGEARVLRQTGDPAEALSAISPLLADRGDSKIKRLAQLEALEARLMIDPRLAIAQAQGLGGRADWVLARAHAALGERDAALKYARSDAAVAAAPAYERLKLIAELDGLNDDERTAWVRVLSGLGLDEKALGVLDERAPLAAAELYAVLLQRAGRDAEAVSQWQRVVENGAGPGSMLAYAVSLEVLAGDQPEYRGRALDAFQQVFTGDAPDALRRDALRRWVYLVGPDGSLEVLKAQGDLVAADPYLRYARAVALRNDSDPAVLAAELEAVESLTQDGELKASAVLLRSQVEPDPRAALTILTNQWDLLTSQPATAEAANRRRVSLWVGLGMIDLAADQMLSDPGSQPSVSLLMVGSALADRYADGVRGDEQTKALRLAGAAISRSPGSEETALSAARLMLRIGARADAVRVLSSLDTQPAKPLLAEALRGLGRTSEALEALKGAASPRASLERGLCLLDLGRADEALDEVRAARKGTQAGGDTWWEATLAFARVQIVLGNKRSAADVLRVAEALYPVAGRGRLRVRLEAIQKELEG